MQLQQNFKVAKVPPPRYDKRFLPRLRQRFANPFPARFPSPTQKLR